MAKSYTQKNTETKQLKKIAAWTQRNLKELRETSVLPICVKLANGNYQVGTYDVVKLEYGWLADSKEFFDKRSAIFYCALKHLNKMADANNLLDLDSNVRMLEFERYLFRTKLDSSHVSNNEFKIGLYSSRYEVANRAYKLAKLNLETAVKRQFRQFNINNSNTSF